MHSLFTGKPAEHLQVCVLVALHGADLSQRVDAILALEELTRRAQSEDQRQAAEDAVRRQLGEERG